MAGEKEQVEGYMATVNRVEPNIHMLDRDATLTSIAISLKRIADAVDVQSNGLGLENLAWNLGQAFGRGIELGRHA